MERGVSLATRYPDRCHVLLLACAQGVAPQVIDCFLAWSKRRGGVFEWYHCDSNKNGMLVNVAQSRLLTLVRYLLSFDEMDVDSNSNAPIKVVDAAINSALFHIFSRTSYVFADKRCL